MTDAKTVEVSDAARRAAHDYLLSVGIPNADTLRGERDHAPVVQAFADFERRLASQSLSSPTEVERLRAALERAEAAQLNLFRQAERDREARKRAEEAFDLIAPFVAKFAAAVPHYAGGKPRFKGTSNFFHDPVPGSYPALAAACTAPTGNGSPPEGPTIADLRMLADAYSAALEGKDHSHVG